MVQILKAAPLYTFLWFCNQSPLTKTVLDCGAGGSRPPLSLFHEAGYQTIGLEVSDERLQMAVQFEKERGIALHIHKGDMRQIPLSSETISFAYSFNSIFHLERADIARAIQEIGRVLVPAGLCFINFLSIDDEEYGRGVEVAPGTFWQNEDGRETIHTYFMDDEGDGLFSGFRILRKEKRIIDTCTDGEVHRMAFLDFIARKV